MTTCDLGRVLRIESVVEDLDTYPRKWGMGSVESKKKMMVERNGYD